MLDELNNAATEKNNDCGIVTENYCRKRCGVKNNYPQCDNPVQQKNVDAAKKWIKQRCWKRKTINYRYSSYGFKHVMEAETRIYVTNGDFIKAATLLGYKAKRVNYPNCSFNMGIKTEHNKRFWNM